MFSKKKKPLPPVSDVVNRISPLFGDLSKWRNCPDRGQFDLKLEGPAHILIRLYSSDTILYDLSINRYDIPINDADRLFIRDFTRRWLEYSADRQRAHEHELAAQREAAINDHLTVYNL